MIQQHRLTGKQEMFCREYIVDFNATRAAIAAGYSRTSSALQADMLLKNPKIREHIKLLQAPRVVTMEATRDRVLQELTRIAFADIRELYDEYGMLRPIHELSAEVAATIASVEVETRREKGSDEDEVEVRTRKMRAWDKLKALEMLAKHLQLYSDAPNITVPVQVNINELKDLSTNERALIRQLAESRANRSQDHTEAA